MDSRSFSFDAGTRSAWSRRRYKYAPASRTETLMRMPAVSWSMRRIHLALTICTDVGRLVLVSFSSSWRGHRARSHTVPRSLHAKQGRATATEPAPRGTVCIRCQPQSRRRWIHTSWPVLSGETDTVRVAHSPAATEVEARLCVTATATATETIGEVISAQGTSPSAGGTRASYVAVWGGDRAKPKPPSRSEVVEPTTSHGSLSACRRRSWTSRPEEHSDPASTRPANRTSCPKVTWGGDAAKLTDPGIPAGA
jgi:hypothetical protein